MNLSFEVMASFEAPGGALGAQAPAGPPAAAPLSGEGFSLDYVTVDFLLQDLTGVPGPDGSSRRPVVLGSYPNPFSQSATIRFDLPKRQAVTLRVFDIQGRRVRDLFVRESLVGPQEFEWDGKDDDGRAAPAGVYFFRLETDGLVDSRKIVLRR
jgi:hypothetical protein